MCAAGHCMHRSLLQQGSKWAVAAQDSGSICAAPVHMAMPHRLCVPRCQLMMMLPCQVLICIVLISLVDVEPGLDVYVTLNGVCDAWGLTACSCSTLAVFDPVVGM